MKHFYCPYCFNKCTLEQELEQFQHALCMNCHHKHVYYKEQLVPLFIDLPRTGSRHRGECPFCHSHYAFDDTVSALVKCPECQKDFFVEAVTGKAPAPAPSLPRPTVPEPRTAMRPGAPKAEPARTLPLGLIPPNKPGSFQSQPVLTVPAPPPSGTFPKNQIQVPPPRQPVPEPAGGEFSSPADLRKTRKFALSEQLLPADKQQENASQQSAPFFHCDGPRAGMTFPTITPKETEENQEQKKTGFFSRLTKKFSAKSETAEVSDPKKW